MQVGWEQAPGGLLLDLGQAPHLLSLGLGLFSLEVSRFQGPDESPRVEKEKDVVRMPRAGPEASYCLQLVRSPS